MTKYILPQDTEEGAIMPVNNKGELMGRTKAAEAIQARSLKVLEIGAQHIDQEAIEEVWINGREFIPKVEGE